MWFKVDDKFPDHPKARGLEAGHLALWLLAGCWCSEYETDGRISREVACQLAARFDPQGALIPGEPPLISRLCMVPPNCTTALWERTETGYELHDFLDYNPAHAQLELERKRERRRRRKGRREQVVARKRVGANVARTRRQRGPDVTGPDPTRPVPSLEIDKDSLTVRELTDFYRAIPGVEATPKDGGVIAGQVGKCGPQLVATVLRKAGASIGAAKFSLQYFVKACEGESMRKQAEVIARPAVLDAAPGVPMPKEIREQMQRVVQKTDMAAALGSGRQRA